MDELWRRACASPPAEVCYVDLDGTLLGPGGSVLAGPDGEPTTRAVQALVDAQRDGLVLVPVSGRQRRQVQHDGRLLGLPDVIGEAGCVTVRAGKVSYAWGQCPRHLGSTPHEALVASGAVAALQEAFPDDLRPYEPWHRGREGSVLLHGRVDVAAADDVLAAAGCGWAHLLDNGAAAGWPGRDVHAYHLLPRGVGKAKAVAADLAARGIAPEQAAAVGDSPADARIAEVVGLCAQVANGRGDAPGVVRTRGAMGEGVAEFIDVLLRARRR